MRWKCVAALAAVLALGGCGTPDMVGTHAVATTDQFSKDITIEGPQIWVNPLGGTVRVWNLRSWVTKDTHKVTDQLYVFISYISYAREYKFFNRAADENAQELPVVLIDRSHGRSCRGGCTLYETIGVMLDDATLRAHAATGYAVKVWAHSGAALVLTITPRMIAEQIAVIDRYVHPAAAPKAVGQQGPAK